MPSNDELRQALEGATVQCGTRTWQVLVYAIRPAEGRRWIQIGLLDTDVIPVVVDAGMEKEAAEIIVSLEQWLRNADRDQISVIRL